MIADWLKNWERYFNSSLMRWVCDFLNSVNEDTCESDFQVIDGGRMKTSVMSYYTRNRWDTSFESHKRYIDVQYTIRGKEIIEVSDESCVKRKMEYNPEKDVLFYYPPLTPTLRVINNPTQFVVLFPGEVHGAGISLGTESEYVKKAVVKIEWDTFTNEEGRSRGDRR
ncbi:MAG: YhcH/YjgK/YiaL family protein [Candidatus Hydrogenedentes bacterium]|nr:YhcH/YjgK/YiaL family protein [Candidatus Hydrogenedentota bacterium]